jgi:hypothetical protein
VSWILAGAIVLLMLVALATIPLGLPGLWLMVVVTLGLTLAGSVGWKVGLGAAAAAAVAEIAEFVVLRHFGRRYGGSPLAFWGAVVGGLAGLFVGVPVPVVGPIVTAFVGTFVGAGLVTWLQTRSLEASTRVGWGLVLARTLAVGLKVATGLALVVVVALALLL